MWGYDRVFQLFHSYFFKYRVLKNLHSGRSEKRIKFKKTFENADEILVCLRVLFLKTFHIWREDFLLIVFYMFFCDEAQSLITYIYSFVNKYQLVGLLNEVFSRLIALASTWRKREARSAWERYSRLNVAFNLWLCEFFYVGFWAMNQLL